MTLAFFMHIKKAMGIKYMLTRIVVAGMTMVVALCVQVANGSAITIDGSLKDWGIADTDLTRGYVSSDGLNYPISGYYNYDSYTVSFWEENGVGASGLVGPGYGGQQFDIEGLYLTYDSSYLYVAATVGIPQSGSLAPNPGYYLGDFALSFDGAYNPFAPPVYGFEYGIETRGASAGALYSVTSWQSAINYPSSNPYNIGTGTQLDSSQVFKYEKVPGQQLYVIETRVDRTKVPGSGTVTLSLTQSCGNDIGRVTTSMVPEPSSLLLLGSGLLGLAGLNRRKLKA